MAAALALGMLARVNHAGDTPVHDTQPEIVRPAGSYRVATLRLMDGLKDGMPLDLHAVPV
jgi:hypothetical protein